ncbi:MAG: peroxiredoxin [Myxococcota bacterium]|jgi:peroxiredoxin
MSLSRILQAPRFLLAPLAIAAVVATGACDSLGDPNDSSEFPIEGDLYPAAMVQTCDGTAVALADRIGQSDVTFITFAAKWCTACQKEAPIINTELIDGLAGRSVDVIQLLVENDPDEAPPLSLCSAWRDDLGARFDVLIDVDQNSVPQHFGTAIETLPLHFIVTRDGKIRLRKLGALPEDIKSRVEDWLP